MPSQRQVFKLCESKATDGSVQAVGLNRKTTLWCCDESGRLVSDSENQHQRQLSNREMVRRLWPLFRPHRAHFVGAFVLLLIAQSLMVAGPWLIKYAIDVDIAGRDLSGLRRTVALFFVAHAAHVIAVYLMRNWLEVIGQRMMADLRRQLVDHLLELPLAFHDRTTAGKLMSRVESDTQALRVLFTTTSVMLVGDVLLFIGMFVVMYVESPQLTLLCSLIIPVMIALTLVFQRRIHPIFVRVRELNSELASRMTELLQAMPVIQAFSRERWAAADFHLKNQHKFDAQMPGERSIIFWFNAIHALQTVAIAIVLGVGGYWSLSGTVTVGVLTMFLGYIRRFFQPLLRLSEQLATIQKAFAAGERLFQLLHEPVTVADPVSPRAWLGNGCEIEFRNVWFHYDTMRSDDATDEKADDDWILRDVSFRIPAKKCFALIGPTGSGKTTIIGLLQRFYDPQRGSILIDGIDIREFSRDQVRERIGIVAQDIYLFPGSLSENLTLGRQIEKGQLQAAARSTLSDQFVTRLPNSWDSEMAEGGANFSLGQRQLLSFTRAMLREPEILILDEATSAVDPATEAVVTATARKLLADRTAVVIAHRLSTIRSADCVIVLEQGRIVQMGTHDDLIERPGKYRELQLLQQFEESGSATESGASG